MQRQSEVGEASQLNITVKRQSESGVGEGGSVTQDVEQGIQQAKGGGTDLVMRRLTPPVHSLIQRQENQNADKGDPVWRIKGILDGDPLWSLEQEPEPYKILDPLWILHMLKVLEALKSGRYLEQLSSHVRAAKGVYRERIEVAIKAVQSKGKVSGDQFKMAQGELLKKIPDQQQLEVLRYLDSHKIKGTKEVRILSLCCLESRLKKGF